MADSPLLTVPQVAAELQVTSQTIRNWIDHGTLPAVRIGRAFRVRRADVDEMLRRASAESRSLATRRDLWRPATSTLPRRRDPDATRSAWDPAPPSPPERASEEG
jgi:excisionase family DNA binding protein